MACGYVAYYVLVGALSLRLTVEKEHGLLLFSTPQWLMMLLLLAIAAYLVAHGAGGPPRLSHLDKGGEVAVISRPQGRIVVTAFFVPDDGRRVLVLHEDQVGEQAGDAPVTIGEGVDCHQPMMKASGQLDRVQPPRCNSPRCS